MTAIIMLCFLTVSLLGIVAGIDPSAHISFARVFPNMNRRTRRAVTTLSPSAYTEDEKKEMLDAHNEYRRTTEPVAADMNLLTWNVQLAESAQTWAEQCIWDHGQVEFDNQMYDPMGQNLWRGGNKVSVSAVNAWWNEVRYYNFDSDACETDKKCGHYTQVLWGDTKEMGCGFHSCEDGNTIVACNYGPAGNYNRQPYTEGPRCSMCPSPGFCYNGLCSTQCHDESVVSGTCECSYECKNCGVLNATACTCTCKSGWHGDKCADICEDTSSNCGAGWYRAQCGLYSYVDAGCPAMCSLCVEPTEENAAECPCDGRMCKNGGQLNTSTCNCDCTEGYSGDVCDTEETTPTVVVSTCDGKTCMNSGTLSVATCTCECLVEFTGTICENPVTATTVIPAITTHMKTTESKVVTTVAALKTTQQMNKATSKTNEEDNITTPSPSPCQLICPSGFVLDVNVCECIEYVYGDPPVGSANTHRSSSVYVITITTVILFSHLLGTWYH